MIRRAWVGGLFVAVALSLASAYSSAKAAETVSFPSAGTTLHGLLYKPAGAGPFPTLLYDHGSAPGMLNTQAFELVAPLFTAHGWAFFAPYRRGQGLSSDAGPYIGAEIAAAQSRGGLPMAAATMVRLLSTEQLQDQMAAFAWLRQQPFVRTDQIAVMGNSFGGVETVLAAEQAGYCAAVDASGGAESWDKAPALQNLMLDAVRHARAPILFIQAQNDYTTAPSRALYETMHAAGMSAVIHIYPAYGTSDADGHSFAWRGGNVWRSDVFQFIDEHCKR
jgi:carboxymethylenebutenolidase